MSARVSCEAKFSFSKSCEYLPCTAKNNHQKRKTFISLFFGNLWMPPKWGKRFLNYTHTMEKYFFSFSSFFALTNLRRHFPPQCRLKNKMGIVGLTTIWHNLDSVKITPPYPTSVVTYIYILPYNSCHEGRGYSWLSSYQLGQNFYGTPILGLQVSSKPWSRHNLKHVTTVCLEIRSLVFVRIARFLTKKSQSLFRSF